MTRNRGRALERVRQLVLDALEDYRARVYLFGSCAEGAPRHSSDIDIAIEPLDDLPVSVLNKIRDKLEESTIPYEVDVIDMRGTDESFRKRIKEEGLLWRG